MTVFLSLALALLQVPAHEVDKLPGFEIQGVAFTAPKPAGLRVSVRVRGALPVTGAWTLRVSGVTCGDGSPAPITTPIGWSRDIQPGDPDLPSFSPLVPGAALDMVQIQGELVHYLSIEETIEFPSVRLVQTNPGPERHPAMRVWLVPTTSNVTARTSRGLLLRIGSFQVGGGSGRGCDDMACLPVLVDKSTLTNGIERELNALRERQPYRVIAYLNPGHMVSVYQSKPEIGCGMFSFVDREFESEVQLSLHVVRQIVDRTYKFALIVPVQKNKELIQDPRTASVSANAVSWPSSVEPTVAKKILP